MTIDELFCFSNFLKKQICIKISQLPYPTYISLCLSKIDKRDSWRKLLLYIDINYYYISVQILLDEIRKNYDNCTYSSGGCEKNESERVYISITNTSLKHLKNNKVYGNVYVLLFHFSQISNFVLKSQKYYW